MLGAELTFNVSGILDAELTFKVSGVLADFKGAKTLGVSGFSLELISLIPLESLFILSSLSFFLNIVPSAKKPIIAIINTIIAKITQKTQFVKNPIIIPPIILFNIILTFF